MWYCTVQTFSEGLCQIWYTLDVDLLIHGTNFHCIRIYTDMYACMYIGTTCYALDVELRGKFQNPASTLLQVHKIYLQFKKYALTN